MARRKRHKRRRDPDRSDQIGRARPPAFNPALKELAVIRPVSEGDTQTPPKSAPPPLETDSDDLARFREAMSDVRPLRGEKRRVARPPQGERRPIHPPNVGDLEVMAHLADLVSGLAEMDITFSDEYIEGCVKGFDQKLMQRLKQGLFPVQDHVDLHGCTRQEAELRVTEFLLRSYRLGLRCVLVVHGRGLNSEDHIPVLKERLPVWLNRGPVKRIVLAFSTARSYDGGTGAIYVLLRRAKGRTTSRGST